VSKEFINDVPFAHSMKNKQIKIVIAIKSNKLIITKAMYSYKKIEL
jgi:hypothetical protein